MKVVRVTILAEQGYVPTELALTLDVLRIESRLVIGLSVQGELPLFTQDTRVATGAGMASTADFILTRLVAPQPLYLAQSVAQVLLIDDIRDGTDPQPRSENEVMVPQQMKLAPVIAAMEDAVETRLSMGQLAQIAGVWGRQIERRSHSLLGQSPGRVYRSLRLRRAKALVEQAGLPRSEISVTCGFGSQSNFTKNYTQKFGISPTKRRVQLSRSTQIHKSTSEQQGSPHASLPLPPGSSCSPVHAARTHETFVQRVGC